MKGCLQCLIIVCVVLRGKWLVISCCHCQLRSFWMCTRGWKKCILMKYLNLCWKLRLHKEISFLVISNRIFSTTFLRFSFWLQTQFFLSWRGLLFIFEFGSYYFGLFMLDFILMFELLSSTKTTQRTTWKVFLYRLLYFTLRFMMCICGKVLEKDAFWKKFFICKHISTRNSYTKWKHNSFYSAIKREKKRERKRTFKPQNFLLIHAKTSFSPSHANGEDFNDFQTKLKLSSSRKSSTIFPQFFRLKPSTT